MKNILLFLVAVVSVLNVSGFYWKYSHTALPAIIQSPVVVNSFSALPPVETAPLPEKETVPEFVMVPTYRQSQEKGTVYADVLSHVKGKAFGDKHGRATNVHETAHKIHSEIRNEYSMKTQKRFNAFYVLEGRAVLIEEPKIKKSHVNRFLPQSLRSYRYALYMAGQTEWDDTPTYICDEWTAYVLDAMCAVEDVRNGRHEGGWTDGVSGCLDFSIYTIALCMAVKEGDPTYWQKNTQFKAFVIWQLRRANATYLKGHNMSQFQWKDQDRLLKNFLTAPEAETMRNFVRIELEGVWLDAETIKQSQARS